VDTDPRNAERNSRGTCYLSGRITNSPHFRRSFAAAAKQLRADGWTVLDPAGLTDAVEGHDGYNAAMRFDLAIVLASCQAAYFLRGWRDSRGARAEYAVADCIGLELMFQDPADRRAWRTQVVPAA